MQRDELVAREQRVDAAEGDEGRAGDVEAAGELQALHDGGLGVEVHVLRPGAVKVRVLVVVGGRDDMGVEQARYGRKVALGDRVWRAG